MVGASFDRVEQDSHRKKKTNLFFSQAPFATACSSPPGRSRSLSHWATSTLPPSPTGEFAMGSKWFRFEEEEEEELAKADLFCFFSTPTKKLKKTFRLLKVNPQGSVPVAKDLRASASPENPWVVDSGVICDWLESHFPSPPSVGAVADAASAPGGDVFPAFAGFIKAGIGSPEEAEKRSKLDAAVLSLSKAIQESCKPFLGGDAPQQADFALAPKLHHLSVAAPAHKGWAFPEGSGPVSDYLERMRARPSWKAHAYSDESVVAGWKKNVGADAKK